MKVLFLDIDGVLNSVGFRPESPRGLRDWLVEQNVRALRVLVESTRARIVVSSSWRLTTSREEFSSALESKGARVEIVGVTPSLRPGSRAAEIAAWLATPPAPVEAWIALDDEWVGDGDRYYRISRLSGLTDSDVIEISKILNRP